MVRSYLHFCLAQVFADQIFFLHFSLIFSLRALFSRFFGERRGISHWVQTVTAEGLKRGKTDGIRSESLMPIDRLTSTHCALNEERPSRIEGLVFSERTLSEMNSLLSIWNGHSLRRQFRTQVLKALA